MDMNRIYFKLLFIFSIFSSTSFAQTEAKKADDFINSIGVATHLSYSGVYEDANNIKKQILNLGIKHIRDGLDTKFAAVKLLADNGIKTTGVLQGDFNIAAQTPAYWIGQVKKAGAMYAFEAFEGPNEADLPMMSFTYQGQGWPNGVRAFQKDLYNTVKNDPSIGDRPVLGPTIGSGLKTPLANAMGDISPYVDYGNFHYYKAWGQSYSEGYPDWDLQSVKNFHNVMFGNKHYMATEGSYNTAIQAESGINEVVNAKYTLRFFLEYWRLGVVRTFKYELFDEGLANTNAEDKFGLIENDGITIKLAGTSVKNMISLLKDSEPLKEFAPESLNFTITNANNYTHYNLLQKSTGKFYLIIWNDAPSWNADLKIEVNNSDPLTLTFNQTVLEAKLFAPCTNGSVPVSTIANPLSMNIVVPNHPYIYEITTPDALANISETRKINRFNCFPNPAKTELFISKNISENSKYEITSIDGKLLQAGIVMSEIISIENLKAGLYIIKIKTDAGESVQRFVKE